MNASEIMWSYFHPLEKFQLFLVKSSAVFFLEIKKVLSNFSYIFLMEKNTIVVCTFKKGTVLGTHRVHKWGLASVLSIYLYLERLLVRIQ